MTLMRGLLSREELLDLIRVRNELASRYPSVDAEVLNTEITALALHGGLRGDQLKAAVERFVQSISGVTH